MTIRIDVRKSTDRDLIETLDWLRVEKRNRGDSLFCNASVIASHHCLGQAYVARIRGRCVGLLTVGHVGDRIEITAVRPGYRRMGIARRLIGYWVKQARRRGIEKITADCVTERGRALCEALGFRPVDDSEWPRHFTLHLENYFG